MGALLRLRGVEARYGRLVALQNLSLVVPDGAVVALLGRNGAGKTTALRVASGMLPPSRGEVHFAGRPIHRLPDYAVAALGLVHIPEGRAIFPGLTVAENLAMMQPSPSALRRVFEAFPVLEERRDQVAGTLSGGEQQMLSLARALIIRPRLLMVDELSLGLAPLVVSRLFETLARIRDEGTAILLVEQHIPHALRLADLVVVLHKGRVRFIGEPGELQARGELVQTYLGGGSVPAGGGR